ncbi:MAG: phosphotransferase [Elusimicrobiota bacterium]
MPEAWEAECLLDADKVRRLLDAQLPDLKDAPVAYFNEGWDTWIYEVGGKYLFRFPKRESADGTLRMELRLLPELEEAVPLPIPSFEFMGRPSKPYPFHFAGYEKMPGITGFDAKAAPPEPAKIARQLGGFLTRLHSFSRAAAKKLGVPIDENLGALPLIQKDALGRLDAVRGILPRKFFQPLKKVLSRDTALLGGPAGPSRLIHNDLCSEHILLAADRRRVTGIIDWGDAEFGDPAMDFAGLLQWLGPEFMGSVLDAYKLDIDADLRERARFLACSEGVQDMHYGMDTGRKEFALAGAAAARNALK